MSLSPRVVICVSLLAAGFTACHRRASKELESEPPALVTAEPVQIGNVRGVVSATGIVVSLPGADFAAVAPQPARIADIYKKVGDQVNSGEMLVRFEFPSQHAEDAARAALVKAAELRLQSAKLVQSRVHGLIDRGAASKKEVDDADRDVNDAEAAAAEAHAGENPSAVAQQITLRAPFNGVITERLHNPGELVGTVADEVILRLVDPRQVEVSATVPVSDVTRFAVGATARALRRGTPDLMRVLSRPQPDPGATTVTVRLAFEQPTELAAGTEVGVEIDAEQHLNVLVVPAISVVKDDTGSTVVFVAVGNQAVKRKVTVGLVDAERVEIRSGVKPGELIVTQGQSTLRDGAEITLSAPDAAGPPGR